MPDRSTQVFNRGNGGCDIYTNLLVVNKTILVTQDGEPLDQIIIRNLADGLPIVGRVKITVERIE